MSSRGSKSTASAGSPGGRPPTWTAVSLSPATTCALVTTRPGATTQPLPSIPRPHAVPTTRTTLPAAERTPRAARIPGAGGETSAAGPWTDGSGSKRASAWRIGPDGGSS